MTEKACWCAPKACTPRRVPHFPPFATPLVAGTWCFFIYLSKSRYLDQETAK